MAAEEAPKKAERSLTFLLTIIRHLASSLAKAPGESLLEANLLEASLQVSGSEADERASLILRIQMPTRQLTCQPILPQHACLLNSRHDLSQVLKDLFALDDGGSKTAPRRELGNSLCKSGLVPLLLSFLVALGPIRTRAHASSWDPDSFRSEDSPIASSLKKAANGFPRHPPYYGYRTDIVAGMSVLPISLSVLIPGNSRGTDITLSLLAVTSSVLRHDEAHDLHTVPCSPLLAL